jgi:hypothetical protein
VATREVIEEFLKAERWAVVGASTDRSKFGNITFRELKRRGKQVYPVNRRSTQIEGETCYPSLTALPEPVDRVLIVVPPKQGEAVVKEASEAGIGGVWFQPGAESDAALAYCESRGMVAVSGHCILRTR